ncbi:CaiB/BaiF CoA transferase family protein [Hydrogenophaga sp. BPS33]|uniref:CaiB/BaiF CoA transferase family protein n=1 Tax=Hydrogenophaga sp. BPS33 TaxID=2651974 RepID=UPI00131F8F9F|nr:CoA transferase [Hydrogenophaga sp. BPS33]QHE87866.1 CoA transferase [Hydrogenophaga sp. BPS33]
MARVESKGALDGIRVVELTTVILGPWAAQMLGDMGADVIKVETLEGDITRQLGPRRNEGMAALYLATNRNKRSIALDLTRPEGREALLAIVKTADVFIHNLRPKVCARLGLGYEHFAQEQPGLIYCATYGFRADGPMADKPAYDDVIQAASGLADLQAAVSDQPRYVPTVMADKTTAYNVVSAVLAALLRRGRTGVGQAIEVPMFESLVDFVMVEHLYGAGFEPPLDRMGYARILTTERKPYRTLDGHYLAVLPYTDQNWRDFFRVAGREDLFARSCFASIATRVANSSEVYALLEQIVATRSADDWERDLDAVQVPAMRVHTKETLLDDPQLNATGFWRSVEHPTEGRLRMTDPPVRFSESPSSIRRLPPLLGEQSAEILAEAGYAAPHIEQLFRSRVSLCKAAASSTRTSSTDTAHEPSHAS